MKHANIATMTDGSRNLGRYSLNPARFGGYRPRLSRLLRIIGNWHDRACQRRALELLDDRMLQDAGLTRFDAANESAKPFWRL